MSMEFNEFEKTIYYTNKVIDKWITEGRIREENLDYDSIKCLILQYIKKHAVRDVIDFKRISKFLRVNVDPKYLCITEVYFNPYMDEQYFRNKELIIRLQNFYRTCDYSKYIYKGEEVVESNSNSLISLESIKQITF